MVILVISCDFKICFAGDVPVFWVNLYWGGCGTVIQQREGAPHPLSIYRFSASFLEGLPTINNTLIPLGPCLPPFTNMLYFKCRHSLIL